MVHARINMPERFSESNGYIAWEYNSTNIEDAAIEDLFWRILQVSPGSVEKVVRAIFPSAYKEESELFIGRATFFSLHPKSCGAYRHWGITGNTLCALKHDIDKKYLEQATKEAGMQGYYLAPLLIIEQGWHPENVVPNLMKRIGLKLTGTERYLFNKKACHYQVLIGNPDEEYKQIIENAYPVLYGYKPSHVYWYRTETSQVNFGIVYYSDSKGNVYKLPISAWAANSAVKPVRVYDTLNIAPPYPPYDLDKLVRYGNSQTALICDSEATVEYIKREHAWIFHQSPVTAYISVEGTD